MAHQVFVSYATEDADAASRVCTLLEADGIQCWVAPRDVKAGTDYAAAIMNAIRTSQLAVLIFSSYANASPYALREIERAVAHGRPVLGLRLDDAGPNPSLEYYLDEWIEVSGGVESKREEIIAAVRRRLAEPSIAPESASGGFASSRRSRGRLQSGTGKAAEEERGRTTRTRWLAAAAVLAVAAVGLGLGLGLTRDRAAPQAGMAGSQITWTELKPSGTPPSARCADALASDPTSGRLIMFGGRTAQTPLNDTWAYDPVANAWTELEPAGVVPSARSAHSMAYDPVTHRLIMFGGSGDTGTPFNDTWAYDSVANSWAEFKPAGILPTPRAGHSMTHDPTKGRLIMFGGGASQTVLVNDTWTYDPVANTWTELNPTGTIPSPRGTHSVIYDPVTHRLIMFGGSGDTGTPFNDTWAYDPAANTWTELKPSSPLPSARSAHSMAYDLASGRLVMFGGQDSGGTSLDDAWVYDSRNNTWRELEPSGAQPVVRAGHVMVYDPASGRLVMFGGRSIGPWAVLNDTWICTPN